MKKKMDFIEQLIEVSDRCMTHIPKWDKSGKEIEQPCNCRDNVVKILVKAGLLTKVTARVKKT